MKRQHGIILIAAFLAAGARAELSSATTGNPAFRGTVAAIAFLNKAMRDAAENPQDEWRRNAVRNGVNGVSFAINAMSAAYGGLQLDSREFPAVLAMLGGFVDVNAPDNYNKFLINPDKRYIPKVGPGFPDKSVDSAGGGGGGLPSGDPTSSFMTFRSKVPSAVTDTSKLGLKDSAPSESIAAPSPPSKGKDETRLGFDDNAKSTDKGDGTGDATKGNASSTKDGPDGVTASAPGKTAARDLASIEESLAGVTIRDERRRDPKVRDDFFDEKKCDKDSQKDDERCDPRGKLLVARKKGLRPSTKRPAAALGATPVAK